MPLTDLAVQKFKSAKKSRYLIDGAGLYIKVSPLGTKTWFFRRQRPRTFWIKLGRYPAMGLLQARNAAAEIAASAGTEMTVQSAYNEFVASIRTQYKKPEEIERRFKNDILPAIGSMRLVRVTRGDISGVLQRIVKRGAPVIANRTLPDIKHLFDYCVERGWLQSSPAAVITRKSVGGRERARDRALTIKEIERLLEFLLSERLHVKTRIALALLLLTGQRTAEVAGIEKREVRGAWWTIPKERTKTRREQKVYLSPQARVLIRLAVGLFGDQPLYSDRCTLSHAVRRLKFNPPFVPHDLRRTMATRLSDLGVHPHVIEKMLNHQMGGVMAVYNRAEYLAERKAAWRLWGAWLATLRRRIGQSLAAAAGSSGTVLRPRLSPSQRAGVLARL